jgi:ubiquinone/menaquinone biosynthesis C-methylase UbiE
MKVHIKGWNENYQGGRLNRYPFDQVVSFVLGNYATSNRSNVKIIDMGCGGGNHVKFLADEGFDFYGVDGSEKSIELTRDFVGAASEGKLTVADFTNLPYESDFFDALIDRQSMGHNSVSDISLIVNEIYRILKSGGRYHGHVFGIKDAGFAYGSHIGNNDYQNFTDGHFKKAHLVHGFEINEIKKIFESFSELSVQNQVIYDAISGKLNYELFFINAVK